MSSANDLIEKMPTAFDPEAAGDMQMTVQYMIEDPMYAIIDNGACDVHYGQADAPEVTIKIADDDLVQLMTGELNGMTAFMTGRLKVEGDLMKAQKLPSVFDARQLG